MAAINLATDGGNAHVSIERLKNGLFNAKDLRLRFEFVGAGTNTIIMPSASIPGNALIEAGKLRIQIALGHAGFSQQPARWEVGNKQGTNWLDVVLFTGFDQKVDLTKIDSAANGWAMNFATDTRAEPKLITTRKAGMLKLNHEGLELQIPEKPAPIKRQQTAFAARVVN